jgi:hypothetical protein
MVSAFAAWYNALVGIAASNHTYVLPLDFLCLQGDKRRKGGYGKMRKREADFWNRFFTLPVGHFPWSEHSRKAKLGRRGVGNGSSQA